MDRSRFHFIPEKEKTRVKNKHSTCSWGSKHQPRVKWEKGSWNRDYRGQWRQQWKHNVIPKRLHVDSMHLGESFKENACGDTWGGIVLRVSWVLESNKKMIQTWCLLERTTAARNGSRKQWWTWGFVLLDETNMTWFFSEQKARVTMTDSLDTDNQCRVNPHQLESENRMNA